MFHYQWIAYDGTADTDIAGATSATYIPAAAYAGQAVKVEVSFTDDRGSSETLTSAATAELVILPLTANRNEPAPHDGQTAFTFTLWFSEEFQLSYLTLRDHAFTVNGGAVTRAQRQQKPSNMRWTIYVQPDGNAAVTVVLPATEDCDAEGAICTADGRPLSNRLEFTVSGPVEPAPNSAATGAPTISGTAQVGETLTAHTSGIADADGLTNPGFTYQWIRNDGTADEDIAEATRDTYTLVADDEGKTITVRVSFTDDAGNEETLPSTVTASVEPETDTSADTDPDGTAIQDDHGNTPETATLLPGDSSESRDFAFSYPWTERLRGSLTVRAEKLHRLTTWTISRLK